jgi:uncharacterized membrane protein
MKVNKEVIMMHKTKLTMIISGLVALIPVVIYVFLYSKMPDTVPIHYDGNIADRFVSKSSFEVILLSGLGCVGFILMKLLQVLLQQAFARNYIEHPVVVSRIWNLAIAAVTLVFASISSYTLISMVGSMK